MLLGLVAAVAIIGFIVGVRFRAPALLVLTLVIVVGSFAAVWLVNMTPGAILNRGLLLLIAEHAGYMAGLVASSAMERRK